MAKSPFRGRKNTTGGVLVGYPGTYTIKHLCNYPDRATAERRTMEKHGRKIVWED